MRVHPLPANADLQSHTELDSIVNSKSCHCGWIQLETFEAEIGSTAS